MNRALLMLLVSLTVFSSGGKALSNQQETIQLTVGSKKFTESVILGEIVNQLIRTMDVSSHHRHQLGGTRVLWSALLKGEIDGRSYCFWVFARPDGVDDHSRHCRSTVRQAIA